MCSKKNNNKKQAIALCSEIFILLFLLNTQTENKSGGVLVKIKTCYYCGEKKCIKRNNTYFFFLKKIGIII